MSHNVVQIPPYHAGEPVPPSAPLFGRAALLRQLVTELRGAPGVLVLGGERLVGKTSLLLHLQAALPPDSFLTAYVDLGEAGAAPLRRSLAALGRAAGMAPEEPAAPAAAGDLPPEEAARLLAAVLDRLPPERRPVLLLDRIDEVAAPTVAQAAQVPQGWLERLERDEAGGVVLDLSDEIDEEAAPAAALAAGLRRLLAAAPRLALVLTLGPPEGPPAPELAALLEGARRFWVPTLDEGAARALVLSGRQAGVVDFKEEAIDRIVALCGGHPYFLQLLCRLLCDEAYAGDAPIIRKIDAAAVERVAQQVLEAGQPGLSWIFSALGQKERRLLTALGRAPEGRGASAAELAEVLRATGAAAAAAELQGALEALTLRGLLRRRDDRFAVSVELLRRWIAQQGPRRGAPVASLGERLFHVAIELAERRDLDGAEVVLRQALRVEPTHLPARHLLTEVLLAAGRPREALAALEDGDCSTPTARALLGRALLEHGAALDRAGDEEGALGAFARARSVQPEDPRAPALTAALWRRRGEEALGRDELDEAEAAYREAAAEEGLAAVAARRRSLAIERAIAEAERHAAREEWAEAAARYRFLTTEEPAEPRWQEALGRAEGERALAQRYGEGAAALARGERIAAMQALGGVVHERPDYKDAATLLARACPAPAPQPATAAPEAQPAPRPPAPPSTWSRLGAPLSLAVGLLAVVLWALTARAHLLGAAPPPAPPPALTAPPPAPEDPGARAARQLVLAAAALEDRRFDEARAQVEATLAAPGLDAAPRRVAAALQARATAELAARGAYDAFLAASRGDDDAATLERYQQIPPASTYRSSAQGTYEAAAGRFVRDRLAKAEAVRTLGKCGEYQRRLADILLLAPAQPAVKEAQLRPCGPKRAAPIAKKEPRGDEP